MRAQAGSRYRMLRRGLTVVGARVGARGGGGSCGVYRRFTFSARHVVRGVTVGELKGVFRLVLLEDLFTVLVMHWECPFVGAHVVMVLAYKIASCVGVYRIVKDYYE